MDLQLFTGKQCEVSVVEHSRSAHTGKSIVTFQLRYWRAIHAEFMTHRMFSRNAGSSRAIPTEKLLKQIEELPAKPVHWGKNQPGMQAKEEHEALIVHPISGEMVTREQAWSDAAANAVAWSRAFSDAGYHKQIVNRIVEPFSFISVVVTATEWDNWYKLRDHEDAQPEIQDLARTMKAAFQASKPREVSVHKERPLVDPREWHLPYVTMEERKSNSVMNLVAMSAARCARVSYLTHNRENPKLEEDWTLYERLVKSEPLHASPLEHQAVISKEDHRSANLTGGWISHRMMLEQAGTIDNLRTYLEAPL